MSPRIILNFNDKKMSFFIAFDKNTLWVYIHN
jgi:hypothetical protein